MMKRTQEKSVSELMQQTNAGLQQMVAERTQELMKANRLLHEEIAERKKVENTLREAEEKYHSIFENAVEGIYQSSPEGYYIEVNPAFARMMGYDSPEELKSKVNDIGHQLYVDPNQRQECTQVVKEKGSGTFEVNYRRKDGSTGWASNNVRAVWDGNGKISRFEGVVVDITERKLAEKALQKSEEKYRTVLENAAELIVITRNGVIEYANRRSIEFFGYSERALSATPFAEIIHPDDREMVVERHIRRLKGDDIPRVYSFRILHEDGTIKWVEIHSILIFWDGKTAVLSFLIDITDRRKAEDALLLSEQRTSQIIEFLPDATLVIDKDGKVVSWNRAIETMTGVKAEEMLGKGDYEYSLPFYGERRPILIDLALHPDHEMEKRYTSIQRMGDILFGEAFTPNLSPGNVHLSATASVLRDSRGEVIAAIECIRNNTERKQLDDALKRYSAEISDLYNNAPCGYHSLDPEGTILSINDTELKWLGFTRDEIIEKIKWSDLLTPDSLQTFRTNFPILKKQGWIHNLESEVIRKDGSTMPVLLNATAVTDEEGNFVMSRSTMFDNTERKREEAALRESEQLYRTALETSNDGVLIIRDGKFAYFNQKLLDTMGLHRDEVMNKPFGSYLHKEDREKVLDYHRKRWQGQPAPTNYEARIVRPDGMIIHIDVSTAEIIYKGERAIFANIKDTTERKRVEEERRKLHSQLFQAQKMEAIGTLAGGIAHDFNNILGAMMGYAELAKLKTSDIQILPYLEQVLKACGRSKDLVNQILTFSRHREQEKKPILVTPIIKEAMKLLRSSLPSTVEIRLNCTNHVDTILADPTQIHQVLMNLCANAAHAMRERGGVLEVGLSQQSINASQTLHHPELKEQSYLKITVSDTGHGIDPSVMDRIFDPFFTTKGPGEGTGLGLSMVYGIVKNHDGVISVSSEPEKGTTFTIYLPLLDIHEELEGKKKEIIPTGTGRILFVDDEESIASIGKEMLTSLGYAVDVRFSSVDALYAFRANPNRFDLVITDMTMPNMTGVDLAQEMLKIRSEMPIILTTGFSELINEKKAKEMGIKKLIMKPVSLNNLAQAVKQLI